MYAGPENSAPSILAWHEAEQGWYFAIQMPVEPLPDPLTPESLRAFERGKHSKEPPKLGGFHEDDYMVEFLISWGWTMGSVEDVFNGVVVLDGFADLPAEFQGQSSPQATRGAESFTPFAVHKGELLHCYPRLLPQLRQLLYHTSKQTPVIFPFGLDTPILAARTIEAGEWVVVGDSADSRKAMFDFFKATGVEVVTNPDRLIDDLERISSLLVRSTWMSYVRGVKDNG